jgi:hypothetical protein
MKYGENTWSTQEYSIKITIREPRKWNDDMTPYVGRHENTADQADWLFELLKKEMPDDEILGISYY